MERLGTLGSEDLEYKKNLEVALLKLSEIQKNLAYRVVEYGQLVRVDPKDVEQEGRRFYELEDFDKKYSLEIFQEAAVRNRSEFALAKELVQSYNFKDVRAYAIREYPDVARLDINGVDLNTELYNKELTDKALLIANNLVDQVTVFMTTGGSEAKKQHSVRHLTSWELQFWLKSKSITNWCSWQMSIILRPQKKFPL